MKTPDTLAGNVESAVGWNTDTLDSLFPKVYSDLKRLAANHLKNERKDHTLRPTALVHEVYMVLKKQHSLDLGNRKRFLSIASWIMRRVLINYAKDRKRQKRGGDVQKVPIDSVRELSAVRFGDRQVDYLALEEALNSLEGKDPRQVRIVELKHFAGLTNEEVAEELDISSRTVIRDWKFAKAWLCKRMRNGETK